MKFSLSVLLLLCSCLFAFSGGDGSAENPYQISTRADLESVNNDLAANYILMNDIDLSPATYATAVIAPDTVSGDNPVFGPCFDGTTFTGCFNGNGHKVINFTTYIIENDYIGLFGYLGEGGQVFSLGVENCLITGNKYIGGLVGYDHKGIIENCYSTGAIVGNNCIGGLSGFIISASINNCYSTVSVVGDWCIGGLVGRNSGAIDNCYSTGAVTGNWEAGGLAGSNSGDSLTDSFWDTETSGMTMSSGGTGKTTLEMKTLSTFTDAGWDFANTVTEGIKTWYMMENSYPLLSWQKDSSKIKSPEVGGLTVAQTVEALENAGFEIGEIVEVGSKTTPKDKVAQLSIEQGVFYLLPLPKVNIYVSSGQTGNGTSQDPYRIACKLDLADVNNDLAAYYIMTCDIDLSHNAYQISVIGQDAEFTGSFNGNGHKITNLTIDSGNNDYVGFFSKVAFGGQVYDLGIEDCSIMGSQYIGGDYLAGLASMNLGTIDNCHITGTITGGNNSVGGLVACNNGKIIDSYSACDVKGHNYTGGLAGRNTGDIQNSYSEGVVVGNEYVGVLLGVTGGGSIKGCHASGELRGADYAGGLAGKTLGSNIQDCYSNAKVTGDVFVGGFVAYNGGKIIDSYSTGEVAGTTCVGGLNGYNSGTIENCYSVGLVTGESSFGGLVGTNKEQVLSSFWNIETSGIATSAGGTGKTTLEMQTLNTFTDAGWSFTDYQTKQIGDWCKSDGGYPMLFWEDENIVESPYILDIAAERAIEKLEEVGFTVRNIINLPSLTIPSGNSIGLSIRNKPFFNGEVETVDVYISIGVVGDGSLEFPFQISCEQDLVAINDDLAASYEMVCDINMYNIYTNAVIAMDTTGGFGGKFDGNGYSISGLIVDSTYYYLGLFGTITEAAIVKNLSVSGKVFTTIGAAGMIAGVNSGSIDNCHTNGEVIGYDRVGGLCGKCNNATITNSSSSCTISGRGNLGGLVGYCDSGNIERCYASGAVTGTMSIFGGLIGESSGNVKMCYSTGEVTGNSYVGGLVGWNKGSIENCYSIGMVTGVYCGGLVYDNDGSVTNSFWDIETSGTSYSPVGIGKTTIKMRTLSTFTDAGWDFADYQTGQEGNWYMPDGDYPRLFWEDLTVVKIPSVSGLTPDEAIIRLEEAGFTVGNVVNLGSLTIPSGNLIGISVQNEPHFCSEVKPIDLYVSVGIVGDGSIGFPYQISCEQDLVAVNNNLSVSYMMVCDIYLYNDYTAAVIGPDALNKFASTFDGNGFSVKYLNIESAIDYVGLFGATQSNSTVKNLSVYGSVSTTGDAAGLLLGVNKGTIDNCHMYGFVQADDEAGGICGRNKLAKITNSSSSCTVFGDEKIGGLVGYNTDASIYTSFAIGNVTGTLNNIGGLVGYNGSGSIISCYSTGMVKGSYFIGGLVAQNYGIISNCYSTGAVRGSSPSGLVDYNEGSITASFWNTQTSGITSSAGGTGLTTLEMQTQRTFTNAGWDYMNEDTNGQLDLWYQLVMQYPKLTWEIESLPIYSVTLDVGEHGTFLSGDLVQDVYQGFSAIAPNIENDPGWLFIGWDGSIDNIQADTVLTARYVEISGIGTIEDPYQITSLEQFGQVNQDLSASYILMADIDLSGQIYKSAVIAPDTNPTNADIYDDVPFTGSFNGNGCKITGLTISGVLIGNDYIGLFGKIGDGATVSNLTLENCSISGERIVGGVCGGNLGTIVNCSVEGIVSGDNKIGGLCGDNLGSIIGSYSNCEVSGITNGPNRVAIGGFVGRNRLGIIENCYATGSASGVSKIGGFCGNNYESSIVDSYSTVAVSGSSDTGGFIGIDYQGVITDCFWDTQVSEQAASAGGGTGLTTAEMQTQSTFTGAGWDYVNEDANGQMDIWFQSAGEYPKLYWQAAKGDCDYDGYVGPADLAIASEQWLGASSETIRLEADANLDGAVDMADFAMLAGNWLDIE